MMKCQHSRDKSILPAACVSATSIDGPNVGLAMRPVISELSFSLPVKRAYRCEDTS